MIEQDSATSSNLLGFVENPTTGGLTPLPGVAINSGNVASTGFSLGALPNGITMGSSPSGILVNPAGTDLYVTDQVANGITTLSVGTNGVPSVAGTTQTDAGPMGMAFDLDHKYLYVTAYTANTLDGFTLGSNGVPARSTVAATVQTGTGPTCVTISGAPSNANPSHAIYLYTSNQLSNNLTAEQLSETDGSLYQIQGSPFGGSALPTCAVTVPAFPLRNY